MKNLQTRVITDIVTEPVSLTEAKTYCRVTGTQDDDLLESLIKSSRQALEKYTASSFAEKTLHVTWVESPGEMEIPYGPVISIDAVYRIDEEGEETELELNSDFYVLGDQDAIIKLVKHYYSGVAFTSSVRVEYKAGYGNAATETLPEPLKVAILKQIATDYELRENIGVGTTLSNESKALAAPYRKRLWL